MNHYYCYDADNAYLEEFASLEHAIIWACCQTTRFRPIQIRDKGGFVVDTIR